MIAVHSVQIGAILPAASCRSAWCGETMRKPQGDMVAMLRNLAWRRGALRVGYLVLVFAGLELLAGHNGLGVAYLLAGGLGVLLAHRRVFAVLVWSGVAVHGAWVFVNGDQAGLWAIAGGVVGAAVGWLPDSVLGVPAPVLDALESLRGGMARPPVEGLSWQPAVATAELAATPPAPVESSPAPEPTAPSKVSGEGTTQPELLGVRSIGTFQLCSAGRDMTADLERADVVSFTWLYLMARAVIEDAFLSRREVAQALTPLKVRVNPSTRLREHLRAIRRLPDPIARVIVSTPELVRFDADGCDWDVARLRRLRAACEEYGGEVVPRQLLLQLERELAALPPGEFLPGWDAKERSVLNGHLHDDLIRDIRLRVSTLRADLVAALGSSLLAHGRAADAVAPLEAELARSADPRVVESLIKALHETGQHDRAAELRHKFDRGEV